MLLQLYTHFLPVIICASSLSNPYSILTPKIHLYLGLLENLILNLHYFNRMGKSLLFLGKVTFLVILAGGITQSPNPRFTSVPSPTVTSIWSTFRNSKKFWSFTKRLLKLLPETWFWLSTCPNAPFSTELLTNIWRNCWQKIVIPEQCLRHRR